MRRTIRLSLSSSSSHSLPRYHVCTAAPSKRATNETRPTNLLFRSMLDNESLDDLAPVRCGCSSSTKGETSRLGNAEVEASCVSGSLGGGGAPVLFAVPGDLGEFVRRGFFGTLEAYRRATLKMIPRDTDERAHRAACIWPQETTEESEEEKEQCEATGSKSADGDGRNGGHEIRVWIDHLHGASISDLCKLQLNLYATCGKSLK